MDGGVLDLAAVRAVEPPLTATATAIDEMDAALAGVEDDWLVPALADRLHELGDEIGDLDADADHALLAVRLAPTMLGGAGPRTYFVAFTNPAEARGLGGDLGAWAELRADAGRIQVVRTGRTIDLINGAAGRPTVLDGPADYLARYGRLGAGGGGQPTAVDFWSNVTISPDFPSVGDVIAQLYPQSGGNQLDGVLTLDPYAVAALLQITGPVPVPAAGRSLDSTSVVDFLLREQYLSENGSAGASEAVFNELAISLTAAMFSQPLPAPRQLADVLAPVVDDGRLLLWSAHADEEEALRRLGVAGALPAPEVDGLAVVDVNAGGNKLDAYLQRTVRYEAVVDEGSGRVDGTATVTLRNDAPATGLPPDVAGNQLGLPEGTNRTYLSVYSPLGLAGAEVGGAATVPLKRTCTTTWPPGGRST